jgi:O-antigen/teichoic acid export membrane protein
LKHLILNSLKRLKETNILSNFLNLGSIQLSNVLLLILIYPIITRIIGIEEFGYVMLANTFAGLSAIVINYGTNQSGIRDIATSITDNKKLSAVFYTTVWIRVLIFIIFLLILLSLQWFNIRYYSFIILAVPIVIAEVINPLFFYNGTENLRLYNIANLVAKVLIILLVLLFIRGPQDSEWTNFIMGTVSTLVYFVLMVFAAVKHKLSFRFPQKNELYTIGKENFYLTINNISVHLQQSLMIFAIAKWGSPAWLGAYTLCDKVIWSSRILIISVSNAIYPKAAQLYQEKTKLWSVYRLRMKKLVTMLFFLLSLVLFIFPEFIIYILAGEQNETAVIFLRAMAIVPTLAALNCLNVLDLLLKNDIVSIFRIAIILMIISILSAYFLVQSGQYKWFGAYTILIELSALLMYEYVIKKSAKEYV